MSYKLLEHATDAFVEVKAENLKEAFIQAGLAVVDITLDRKTVQEKTQKKIFASGRDLRNLLYNWLEEIIFCLITDGYAISRIELNLEKDLDFKIEAVVFGEQLDLKKHNFKVEIKAPTFHLMEIEEKSYVKMRFLMDL